MVEVLIPVPTAPAAHDGVTIVATGPQARFSLRARDAAGLPPTIMATAEIDNGTALCLGPDEWLLLLSAGAPAPVPAGVHAITDVSHRAIGLILDGPNAAALLQTGCPLDLSLPAFPVGRATRTLFETVEIILWRQSPTRFRVETWRSFAPWLWDALNLAAGDLVAPAA